MVGKFDLKQKIKSTPNVYGRKTYNNLFNEIDHQIQFHTYLLKHKHNVTLSPDFQSQTDKANTLNLYKSLVRLKVNTLYSTLLKSAVAA